MAFVESFSRYPTFSEEEVFEVTGHPDSVKQLKPSNFEGPVAHWANDRMRKFGESIISRQVYVEQPPYKKPHRVAWVYHEGFSDIGDPFAIHHIACDCSGDVDRVDSSEEKQAILGSCSALLSAIDRQADLINFTYAIGDILDGLSYYPNLAMEEQTPAIQNFVARSIVYMLEQDHRHPESWMANVESGWTLNNLMAKIFNIKPDDVEWLSQALALQDDIETDGVVISLSQKQKDTVYAEQLLREVANEASQKMAA